MSRGILLSKAVAYDPTPQFAGILRNNGLHSVIAKAAFFLALTAA
jgi:hypothetical protein